MVSGYAGGGADPVEGADALLDALAEAAALADAEADVAGAGLFPAANAGSANAATVSTAREKALRRREEVTAHG